MIFCLFRTWNWSMTLFMLLMCTFVCRGRWRGWRRQHSGGCGRCSPRLELAPEVIMWGQETCHLILLRSQEISKKKRGWRQEAVEKLRFVCLFFVQTLCQAVVNQSLTYIFSNIQIYWPRMYILTFVYINFPFSNIFKQIWHEQMSEFQTFVHVKFVCTNIFRHSCVSILECKN